MKTSWGTVFGLLAIIAFGMALFSIVFSKSAFHDQVAMQSFTAGTVALLGVMLAGSRRQ